MGRRRRRRRRGFRDWAREMDVVGWWLISVRGGVRGRVFGSGPIPISIFLGRVAVTEQRGGGGQRYGYGQRFWCIGFETIASWSEKADPWKTVPASHVGSFDYAMTNQTPPSRLSPPNQILSYTHTLTHLTLPCFHQAPPTPTPSALSPWPPFSPIICLV